MLFFEDEPIGCVWNLLCVDVMALTVVVTVIGMIPPFSCPLPPKIEQLRSFAKGTGWTLCHKRTLMPISVRMQAVSSQGNYEEL